MITKFNIFEEVRLSDVANIIGGHIEFDDDDDNKFLKFKTISKRINNKKIRLSINWNHSLKHDLLKKLKERTSFKNISELNDLIEKGLDELFIKNINYIDNNTYSLWFSEYNFSVITNINLKNSEINIITILQGQVAYNVKNVIEIKSTLL